MQFSMRRLVANGMFQQLPDYQETRANGSIRAYIGLPQTKAGNCVFLKMTACTDERDR